MFCVHITFVLLEAERDNFSHLMLCILLCSASFCYFHFLLLIVLYILLILPFDPAVLSDSLANFTFYLFFTVSSLFLFPRSFLLCSLLPPLGRVDLQPQLDSAMHDVNDMYLLMEETEKQAVRRALVEERGRFCTFIGFLQPVVVQPTSFKNLIFFFLY